MAVVYTVNSMCKLWPMKTHTIIMMLTLLVAALVIGCGQSIGEDVERFYPDVDSDCLRCDLKGIDLKDAELVKADLGSALLSGSDLTDANLSNADLSGANLIGVYGADFTGALNVPAKYLKD